MASPKSLPQRTCAACRQAKGKKELVRLVRTPQGDVVIDLTGKKAGRGAYLCYNQACWDKALKGNQLEHALKGKIDRADLECIAREGKRLIEELTSGKSQ